MRFILAIASVVRRTTGRIHSPLFWRLLYAALDTRVAVTAMAAVVRVFRRRSGAQAAASFLAELSALFVWSGWPHHERGWMNLNTSRFLSAVRHRLTLPPREEPRRAPARRASPLRIGCLGAFAGLVTLNKEHFEAAPLEVELHVFDLGFRGRFGTYLEPVTASYQALEDPRASPASTARLVNSAQLDVLLVVMPPPDVFELLDRVETPCIVNMCTGSDLLHHPRVDFQLYPQPQADYFAVDGRVFCGTTRSWLENVNVVPAFFLYDKRDLDPARRRPWQQRDPLIVVHGSLYKAARPAFLRTIFGLMQEDDSVEMALIGQGSDRELDTIFGEAAQAGVRRRVHHEHGFTFVRGADGLLQDDGWGRLRSHLERARLAPDPWPLGGGASRLEAYAAGAPSVHLGVRFDPASWGRPQHSIAEVEALRVPRGIATDPEEYGDLCRRCLADEEFADSLASDQALVCNRVTDARAYWLQLIDAHERWLRRRLP